MHITYWQRFLVLWLVFGFFQVHLYAVTDLSPENNPPLVVEGWVVNPQLSKLLSTIHEYASEEMGFLVNDSKPSQEHVQHILDFTQEYFLRQSNKERWQSNLCGSVQEKLSGHFQDLKPCFEGLKMLETINPSCHTYGMTLIHGATCDTMWDRLRFTIGFLKQGYNLGDIYILTGQRDIDPKEHPAIQALLDKLPAKNKSLSDMRFESDIAQLMVDVCDIDPSLKEKIRVISAPKIQVEGNPPQRPNTLSTLQAWVQYLKTANIPFPDRLLAVSSNPFILQQHIALKRILSKVEKDVQIETIGRSPFEKTDPLVKNQPTVTASILRNPDQQLQICLDTLARAFYDTCLLLGLKKGVKKL